MNHVIWTAVGTIGGLVGLAALAGYWLGRLGERHAITEWLWDQPTSPVRRPWDLSEDIEAGVHRRRR